MLLLKVEIFKNMKKEKCFIYLLLFCYVCGMVFSNCTKYPDPPAYFEDYGADSSNHLQRKVLVISIDGATGSEVKAIAPPNVISLEDDGKYSYNVTREDVATDASSWVTLMTGVSYAKHEIKDSSFQFIPDDIEGNEGSSIPFYPNVLTHILPVKTDYQMAVITPWVGLAKYLKAADINIATATDEAVKDSSISVLKRSSALGVMIVDFNSAEIAGNANGFEASNPEYKSSILKIDGYIGEIIGALKQRSNYENEDWLIMVTTNHGGSSDNPKPGFIVVSNKNLKKEEIVKRGLSTVNFKNNGSSSIYATMTPTNQGQTIYDFQKDFTASFDLQLSGKSGNYPVFFGNKMQLNGGVTNGFSLFVAVNGTVTFNTTSGSKFQVNTSTPLVDGKWHNVTLTIALQSNGTRVASMYIDGEFQGKGNLPANANLNSTDPLGFGWQPSAGGSNDFIGVRPYGLMIFDKALDSATIRKTQCLADFTQHPDYEHLTGYWPCDEATGGKIHNTIYNYCHFTLHGSFQWNGMGQDVPCSLPVPPLDEASQLSLVVSNSDLVSNMLYWLKIDINQDWGLEGQPWLNNFEREIYNQ